MFEISYWSIHQEWPALFVVCICVHRRTDKSLIIKCIFYWFYWLSTFRFYWQLKIVKVVKDTYLRHLIFIHKTLIKYMCYTTQNSRILYIFTYLFHSRSMKSHRLMVQVYICSPSPVMMISQYVKISRVGRKPPNDEILCIYTKRHNSDVKKQTYRKGILNDRLRGQGEESVGQSIITAHIDTKCRSTIGTDRLRVWRDLYCATSAITWGLGVLGHIRRTAPF